MLNWRQRWSSVPTLLTAGKTATGIHIPDAVIQALAHGKRPPVTVTINGYSYRSTVAVMDGRFMAGVNAEVRAAAGVGGGDTVLVDIAFDAAPRILDVPSELREQLNEHPAIAALFDSLSYSNQLRLVAPIASAQTSATRDRNIDKALALLRTGQFKPARKPSNPTD